MNPTLKVALGWGPPQRPQAIAHREHTRNPAMVQAKRSRMWPPTAFPPAKHPQRNSKRNKIQRAPGGINVQNILRDHFGCDGRNFLFCLYSISFCPEREEKATTILPRVLCAKVPDQRSQGLLLRAMPRPMRVVSQPEKN